MASTLLRLAGSFRFAWSRPSLASILSKRLRLLLFPQSPHSLELPASSLVSCQLWLRSLGWSVIVSSSSPLPTLVSCRNSSYHGDALNETFRISLPACLDDLRIFGYITHSNRFDRIPAAPNICPFQFRNCSSNNQ